MPSFPPPLPLPDSVRDAFEDPTALHFEPADLPVVGRTGWVVLHAAPAQRDPVEPGPREADRVEPEPVDAAAVESELTAQVARASAQLQLALGRLAGIHAALEGIEGALAALGAGTDCPTCRSGDVRAAVARIRALSDSP